MSQEIASKFGVETIIEEENHRDAEPAVAEESLMDNSPAMPDKETVPTEIHEVTTPDVAVGKPKITPRYLSGSVGSCHDYCKYGKKREDEVMKPWKLARKKPVEVRSEDKSAPEDTESLVTGHDKSGADPNRSAEPKTGIAGRKRILKKNAGGSSDEHSSKMENVKKAEDSPRGSVKKVSKVNPKARKSTQNKKPGFSSSIDDVPEKTVYVVESSINEKGREDDLGGIQQGPSPSASSSRNRTVGSGKRDVDVRKRPPFLPPGTRIRPVRLLSKSRSIGKRSGFKKDKQLNSEKGLENLEAEKGTRTKKAGFLSRSFSRRSSLSRHKRSNSENGLEDPKDDKKTGATRTGLLLKSRSIGRRSGLSRPKKSNSEDRLEDSKAENKTSVKKVGFLSKSRSKGRRAGLSRQKLNNPENGLEDSNAENKTSAKKSGLTRLLSKSRSIGRRSGLSRHKQNNPEKTPEDLEAENKTSGKKTGFLSKSRSIGKRSGLSRHKQKNSERTQGDSKAENKTSAEKTGFFSKARSIGRRSSLSRHKQNDSENGLEDSNAENKTSGKNADVKVTTEILKLSFRKSKSIRLQRQDSILRRLRFRKRILDEDANSQGDGQRITLKHREAGDRKTDGYEAKREKVVLRHREVEGKKKKQTLFNNMIEETAKKLAQVRKSKVKALVGAFETVISLQDRQPSIRLRRRSSVKVKGKSITTV